jgi:hypothetical protein
MEKIKHVPNHQPDVICIFIARLNMQFAGGVFVKSTFLAGIDQLNKWTCIR